MRSLLFVLGPVLLGLGVHFFLVLPLGSSTHPGPGDTGSRSPALLEGLEWLTFGRAHADSEAMFRALAVFEQVVHDEPDSHVGYYHCALTHTELINAFEGGGDRTRALQSLEQAIEMVRSALKRNNRFSDSHRLLGDLYGRLISFKGKAYGALYGPRARKELLRAIELDPLNADAHVGLGVWQLHTPRLFGGNRDEALRRFRKAIELQPDSFNGHVWLGIALRKSSRYAEARAAFRKALEIYPDNPWVHAEIQTTPEPEK